MQHPEEGVIHAWLDGALPPDEAVVLESHVASCKDCAAAVADARGIIAASSRIVSHLDAVPGKVIPAAPRKRRLPSWRSPWVAAIAAGLILFVRGYLNWPNADAGSELQDVAEATIPVMADSSSVSRPPVRAEPQTPVADIRRRAAASDSQISAVLPPANAAVQKSTIAAAQPTAAPPPRPTSAPVQIPAARADVQTADKRLAAAGGGRGGRAITAAASAAGVAAGAAAPGSMLATLELADQSAGAFTGCYEMNASTATLPARFALMPDSAAIPGLLRVQYVDADGRATLPIADLGWTLEAGQVVVKTQARETLLTLRKTGSAVAGESRSGSRNGRVTSCSR